MPQARPSLPATTCGVAPSRSHGIFLQPSCHLTRAPQAEARRRLLSAQVLPVTMVPVCTQKWQHEALKGNGFRKPFGGAGETVATAPLGFGDWGRW